MSEFVAELIRGDGPVRATGIASLRTGSWVIGDVRLDGRDALRDALRDASGGTRAPTPDDAPDTALVLAAWNAWHEGALERLRGDFSFALWDSARRVLFCARDAIGVRPLYWAEFGDSFICSNVLRAAREHPRASTRLHEPAVVSFLQHGYNADTASTTFADVHRLAPAHRMTVSAATGRETPRKYWSFPVPEPLRLKRDDEYVERFRAVIGDAVHDRLRGNRAAILLSGGLDSTSLAATARRVAPNVALHAWTDDMGPSAPAGEVRLASSVAARLGIAHDVVNFHSAPLAHLEAAGCRTPEPLDEPEWGSWLRLLERISVDASQLVIGEDGDALFRPPGLLAMLRTWPAGDVMRRVLSYTLSHRHHPHLGIWLRRRLAAPFRPRVGAVRPWIRSELLARAGAPLLPRAPSHPARSEAVRYLADPLWQSVLEPAQRAYTGIDLDLVWPLLDTRVIDFVFSVPPVPWCQRKELIRRSFRTELPAEVLSRNKSPLHGFFERQVTEWRAARRASPWKFGAAIREFVDTESVEHTLQRGPVEDVLAAWRVLSLDRWLDGVRLDCAA